MNNYILAGLGIAVLIGLLLIKIRRKKPVYALDPVKKELLEQIAVIQEKELNINERQEILQIKKELISDAIKIIVKEKDAGITRHALLDKWLEKRKKIEAMPEGVEGRADSLSQIDEIIVDIEHRMVVAEEAMKGKTNEEIFDAARKRLSANKSDSES